MKIIDFHTHPTWRVGNKIAPIMTDGLFVDTLRRAGISAAAGSSLDLPYMSSTTDYAAVMRELNRRVFEMRDKYPDFIIPGIHVQHNAVAESIAEIEKYIPMGLKLIGELVPHSLGGRKLEQPEAYGAGSFLEDGFFEIFKVAEERGLAVSIHTSTPDEGRELARRFKNLNIVMAHAGPVDSFIERVKAVSEYDNLFFDISGSGTLMRGVVEYAYNKLGREKVVFGTDFPGYDPGAFVGMVQGANIPDSDKEYIFHKNAERLLGL